MIRIIESTASENILFDLYNEVPFTVDDYIEEIKDYEDPAELDAYRNCAKAINVSPSKAVLFSVDDVNDLDQFDSLINRSEKIKTLHKNNQQEFILCSLNGIKFVLITGPSEAVIIDPKYVKKVD